MTRLRALLAATCALAGANCSRELSGVKPIDRKVLFVTIEGLDLEMVKPMQRDGRMPRLTELLRRGMAIPLLGEHATLDLASVGIDPARSWTTIATGAPPNRTGTSGGGAHGITELLTKARGSYDDVPVTAEHRRLPAFWDVLSAAGVRCAIVNWWTTWPAEPVNGYLVSDRFLLDRFELGPFGPAGRVDLPPVADSYRHGAKNLTWPDSLADELAAELKPSLQRPPHPVFPQLQVWLSKAADVGTHDDLLSLKQSLQSDWIAKESAIALLRKDGAIRFCACHLDSLDVACHGFWKHIDAPRWLRDPDPAIQKLLPPDYRNFADVIPSVAAAIDSMLGELVDAMGKDAVVLLVSDHGMQPDLDRSNRDFNLNRLLEKVGLLVRDANGAIDWSRTKVFDHPDWPPRFGRVLSMNFEGDWPHGIVKGGTEKERLDAWEEVKAQLFSLKVDPPWKAPNGRTYNGIFWGCDVMGWDMEFAVYQSFVPSAKVHFPDGDRPLSQFFPSRRSSAKHSDPGVLFVAYPGAEGEALAQRQPPLGKDACSSVHVAPFVLALFGIPRSMDEDESGASADMLYWLLEREEAHRVAIARVSSYAQTLRRDDPGSLLGARRADLRKYVEELGDFGPPPPSIPPPVSTGPKPPPSVAPPEPPKPVQKPK